MKSYELIEHTADIGIRVKANCLKNLFKKAALSIFDIIAEGKPLHRIKTFKIVQQADNLEELFINWLNELLSLSGAKEVIFSGFKFDKLDEHSLEAVARGGDIKDYRVKTEVKAATYHQLKIAKNGRQWQAEVIFDV